MNIIKIEGREVIYPVGLHMDKALKYVNNVAKVIKDQIEPSKSINLYCTGSSGSIISSLLYSILNNDRICVCHIKKKGEESHSGSVTNYSSNSINIIIDDFSYSGSTLNVIYDGILKNNSIDDIIIHYLILSGVDYASVGTITKKIKPINIITTSDAIEHIEDYKKDQEIFDIIVPVTTELEAEIPL